MKRCAVWRCKQCNAIINNAGESEMQEKCFDKLFESKNICDAIIGYETPNKTFVHHCNSETVGICELIGWRKIG